LPVTLERLILKTIERGGAEPMHGYAIAYSR
jgi:hypothetical protein